MGATTLQFERHYNIDGTLQSTKEPALGGLPSEIVDYGYTGTGQLTSLGGKLLDVSYSALGQAQQLVLGTANTEEHKKAYVTSTWEEGTGRLLGSHVTTQTHAYKLQNLLYTYDQAGNVTSVADTSTLGGTASAETQCFTYDGHRRMTEAWTPASQQCSDTRSATSLGGRAPYWTGYTYDDAGQRTTETTHASTGNTTTTYCYEKADQPHALTGTSTEADCAAPDRAFDFDSTGNTTSRPDGTATQDLDWSDEGKLNTLTENGATTDYLYGAGGTLLIRATEGGERVLYAGATELHLRTDGSTWAQRHYGSGDLTVAVRSNESGSNELSYLVTDPHGTASLAIDATDQAFSRRYTTPFGAPRGSTTGTAWPDDKGFLGKTTDTGTGLTHVGARQYDPELGQFISIDPLLQTGVGQTLNGYSYAVQNPATIADPSGLGVPECREPQKYGITCRAGIPVSSGSKSTGNDSEGPVRACRCGTRPPLVQGNTKPTGLGGIPGRRNLTLPSAPAPTGWLRTVPSESKPKKGPGPVENFVGGIVHETLSMSNGLLGGWLAEKTGYDTTQGVCVNASATGGIGFAGRGCVMVMQTSQGYEVGFAGSLGPQVGSPGAGITLDRHWSNSDDYDQLRGWASGADVSIGAPVSGHASWGTGGVYNSSGALVGELELGVGADVFVADVSGGPTWTWIGEW